MESMNLIIGLGIVYMGGMTTYIILNQLGRNTNHKTLDISDKIRKYKKMQIKFNNQFKNEGMFK